VSGSGVGCEVWWRQMGLLVLGLCIMGLGGERITMGIGLDEGRNS